MRSPSGIGAPRKRKEDPRFLTGASCFTDDIVRPGQQHGVVVRSPHAHARIRAVDVAAARAAPGVRLVLTAADIRDEVVRPIPSFSRTPPFDIRGPDGSTAPEAEQFPLAGETVRYAGQPVVFVVADTLAQAQVEEGRPLAARMLEAAAADVTYGGGRFTVSGTDRGVGLFEVAAFAERTGGQLAAQADFAAAGDVHANGCHACEVTVDPEEGTVRIERHVIVADVGRAINPLIVHGQMHGGAAQGVGQALMEHVLFEDESGQPLTGSFMEYPIPRADELPLLMVELNEVAEPDNPLGVKGAGENATTGSPAAVMNAVRDALQAAGAGGVDMPATREQIWRALRRARPSS